MCCSIQTTLATVPSSLIRVFRRREHARSFIERQLRFGLLEHYRAAEDARKDEEEGRASFYWNQKARAVTIDLNMNQIVAVAESQQNIHCSGSSINPHFILSTSHPDASKRVLTEKFGQFVVRINEPMAL